MTTEIRTAVRSGNIEKALRFLINVAKTNSSVKKNADILKGRHQRLKRKNIEGVITYEMFTVEENKIVEGIVAICNHIDYPDKYPLSKDLKNNRSYFVFFALGIGIAFFILVFFIVSKPHITEIDQSTETHGEQAPIVNGDNNVINFDNTKNPKK